VIVGEGEVRVGIYYKEPDGKICNCERFQANRTLSYDLVLVNALRNAKVGE
jgi:hypothetical protein